jgi:hypothetical protein
MIPYFMMHNRAGMYLYEDLTTTGIRPIAVSFKKREEGIFTIHLGGTDKLLAWTPDEYRVLWTTEYNDSCHWCIFGSPLTYTYIMANGPGRPMLTFSDDKRLVIEREGGGFSWGLSPTYCPCSRPKV